MNRPLLFCLLLLAAPAMAQQVYMRIPGTGYCDVVGASNETPVRITFTGSCGLTNGATILVLDVRGNLGPNIHLNNPSDTANLARKVSGLAFDSFLLMDLNNQPVAGTGDYTGGGRIGLAQAYTMKPPPVMFFDGPTGPRTAAMNDTANKKTTSNPAYQGLLNASNNYAANYGSRWGYEFTSGFPGSPTATAAIHWYLTGNAAAKNVALFSMRNPDQLIGSTACREDAGCIQPASSIADYPLQYGQTYYQAYSLMRGEMTPAERAHFLEFLLADLPWTQAGINYTGVSLIKPDWKVVDMDTSGTVTVTAGSTTVTGAGTQFTTQVAVGDVVYIPHGAEHTFAAPYVIDAITSDTEMTLSTPLLGSYSGVHWQAGPRWDETMYGFLWNQKHFPYTPLNGAGINVNVPSPYYGGLAGFYQSGDNNLAISRALGMYGIGLATCVDDPRGCLLASQAFEWMYDVSLPYCLMVWTGFSQAGNIYHQGRVTGPVLEWALWSMNSFESFPDPLAGTDIREKLALHPAYAEIPQNGVLPNSEGALLLPSVDRLTGSLSAMAHDKNATTSKNFNWWLQEQFNYGVGPISYAGGAWAWENFVLYEPLTATETPSLTRHFKDNNEARCLEIFGSEHCPMPDARRMSFSRVDWDLDSTYVAVNAQGYACRDHCGDDTGGYFHIFKNGKGLLSNDSLDFLGPRTSRGYVEVGSVDNLIFYPNERNLPVLWTGGGADHMSIRMNVQPLFKTTANVTSLERQIVHAKKGSQDYVVDHVKGAFSTAQSVRGLQHFHLNECGTPSSTSCVTLDRANLKAVNTQSDARLSSQVIPVSGAGSVIVTTESGSETNGSYSGGANRTFRWHVCPSVDGSTCTTATALEYMVVHMPSGSTTATLPSISHSVIGPFRTVEILDSAAPKFVALTVNGATATTLTANTTHSGTAQYVVVGLEPGPYTASRNGVSLGPPIQVADGDHSLSFESLSGEISIVPGPPPLTITTLTLPNAVIGRPYNGLVQAISSTPPYQWDITAGALCAGHSLTPGATSATITGTATTLGPCTFTIRVRDAEDVETDSRLYTITVVNPGPDPLQITTTQLPVAREGDAYSRQLLSSGGTAPVSWSIVAGTLCSGLTLHSSTGVIDGTPTVSSSCTFTVRVTDLGNVTVDRQFTLTLIPNVQSPLYISAIEASESAAVVRFGRRGLAFDQACSVELRLGGPFGGLLQTLQSPLGPGRRVVVASALPGGQTIHAGVTCGAETASAFFETGFTPEAPRSVAMRFSSLVRLGVHAHDVVVSFGPNPTLPDSVTGSCSSGECAVIIGADSPLLYWQARFRDSGGATLALSSLGVKAPR